MKRWIAIFFLPLFSLPLFAGIEEKGDAFVRQEQKRDSILIADQLRYGVSLEGVEDGSALGLPVLGDTLMQNILIVDQWRVDTLKVHKKQGTRDIEASMLVTSFDEGEYLLPGIPVAIRRPGGEIDTLIFRGQDVLYCSMPVDTATFKINDIKGQVKYPVTFRELLPWILLALLFAGLCYGAWYWWRRHLEKVEQERHKDPAHIIALRKLDGYRGDKYWAENRQKAFYSGVTDALREYMSARYDIPAMEMTSAEIFSALKKSDMPADLKEDLQKLFERSDYVKFAKYVATSEENAEVLPLGVRFVTTTYQEEIEGENGNVL